MGLTRLWPASAVSVSSTSFVSSSTNKMGLKSSNARFLSTLDWFGLALRAGGRRPVRLGQAECGSRRRARDAGAGGQRKEKRRALTRPALGPGPAAMPRDDAAHIGQADAHAFKLVRVVQPLEHAEELVRVLHV